MRSLGYDGPRIARILSLYLPSVEAFLRRLDRVRGDGKLVNPRTRREQAAVDYHRRRRARAAAERAARALWARCAAPLDDVGYAAAIVPTTDELLDLVFEPDPPPCPEPTRWEQRGHQRTRWGEESGQAKLTREAAAKIRQDHAAGVTVAELARRFGVVKGTITAIVKGRTWLEPPDESERDDEPPPPAADVVDDQVVTPKTKRHRWRSPTGAPKFGAKGSGSLYDDDGADPPPPVPETEAACDPIDMTPAPTRWTEEPDDDAADIADD